MSVLMNQNCENLAHPYLLPTGKFGFNVKRAVDLSKAT